MCDVWRCENCRAKNQRNKEKLLDRYSKTLFESENASREKEKIKGNMDGNKMMGIFCVFALNFFLHCVTENEKRALEQQECDLFAPFSALSCNFALIRWGFFFPFLTLTVLCMFVCLFVCSFFSSFLAVVTRYFFSERLHHRIIFEFFFSFSAMLRMILLWFVLADSFTLKVSSNRKTTT